MIHAKCGRTNRTGPPQIYRMAGRFARAASEFADAAIAYLAEQVGAAAADLANYD